MTKLIQSRHDETVLFLFHHPEVLGLEGVIFKSLNCSMKEDGHLVYEPDLLFLNNQWVVVEYKCNDNHEQKALNQLYVAQEWIRDHWNTTPLLIYAYGLKPDYKIIQNTKIKGGKGGVLYL